MKLHELIEQKMNIQNNLDDLSKLFSKYDNFHLKLKAINVVGTNGKGTTSKSISNILVSAGYNVGLFISPHVISVNERIQFNNTFISDKDFNRIGRKYIKDLEKYQINFFSIYYFIAMVYFAEKKCDYVILEAGIGGEKDSTNLSNGVICCLTSISYDHINILGKSLQEITKTKIGILKEKQVLITHNYPKSIMNIIVNKTKKTNSQIIIASIVSSNKLFNYQKQNYALAITVARLIGVHDLAINSGFQLPQLPGRMERIQYSPSIILDGAHNEESIENLIREIKSLKMKNVLILFASTREDHYNFYKTLKHNFPNTFYLKKEFYKSIKNIDRRIETVSEYKTLFKQFNNIIFCGSFYFISEIRKELVKND